LNVSLNGVDGSVSAIGVTRASYWPTNSWADCPSASPVGRKRTVASFANGESKLGTGSKSFVPFDDAPWPSPRCANAFHRMSWLTPLERIWSAASIALRASTMLTCPVGISSQASYMSWIQRRLPGHAVTGSSPRAHDTCSAGLPAP
jgi:hypothetical protein